MWELSSAPLHTKDANRFVLRHGANFHIPTTDRPTSTLYTFACNRWCFFVPRYSLRCSHAYAKPNFHSFASNSWWLLIPQDFELIFTFLSLAPAPMPATDCSGFVPRHSSLVYTLVLSQHLVTVCACHQDKKEQLKLPYGKSTSNTLCSFTQLHDTPNAQSHQQLACKSVASL